MPHDRNWPQYGDNLTSARLRGQWNGLDDKIAALPAGPKGDKGETGETGPPLASAVVDSTTTLDPGEAATVSSSFDGTNVHLSFGIPRGQEGPPGEPGEVTTQQLNNPNAGTAKNINAISLLVWEPNDPPTADDPRTIRDKLNEVINGLYQ